MQSAAMRTNSHDVDTKLLREREPRRSPSLLLERAFISRVTSNLEKILSRGGVFGEREVQSIIEAVLASFDDQRILDPDKLESELHRRSFSKNEAKELSSILAR